ncbi:N-6 DNA methylase [Corynebacterium sp. zg254]|uniref:site-specific DNA-methyltransferase (adenine-specific) n=1 Tax=Corynebacterium zhongnanshanii TaxID=2768834 RepID=A0ABQ6VHY0_9CORY|nr:MULTISPECIES: class I SAM-dependent DNA methyltransferase [Corynebacterium]KAB1550742.1 N-6 DNA methylase [Corynebacterium sp. 321]KAB3519841.1 N-6 DNA methylase [Corynebacterium zhongnanshanii]MCR5914775.1 N-6 DNA methylase [Corynebacterium sp. zg254]
MTSSNSLYQAVWGTADTYLRGTVSRQNYGDFILPFTVLRRLECALKDTKPEVLETVKQSDHMPDHLLDATVLAKYNLPFYSSSPLSLEVIASSDDNVMAGMLSYLDSFNNTVREVWKAFKFPELLQTLEDGNVLWGVVSHFAGIDLSDAALSKGAENSAENAMGDLFEDLMYRSFSENGQVAGEYYTSREIIRLMVDVLLNSDDAGLQGKAPARTVYDPAAGTCGMLLVAKNAMEELNSNIQVGLAGQEIMPKSYALGRSDLIVSGVDPTSLQLGDTLTNDRYEGQQFDYVLSNPPYGTDWKKSKDAVTAESKREGSRFSHGLPPVNDGQMLFLCHVVDKLKDAEPGTTKGGRGGVVTNGSPLFTGSAGSGPDQIRRWLIEEDYLDAIIALPTDMFYNTGIATYIWIVDKNKEPRRQGKIQLIDATAQWTPMPKSMGNKRRQFSEDDRNFISGLYAQFDQADPDLSKIVTAKDLSFYDVPMFRAKHYSTSITEETVATALSHKSALTGHEAVIRTCEDMAWNDLPAHLKAQAKKAGLKMGAPLLGHIMQSVAVDDATAPEAIDHKGNRVVDPSSKIVERVPRSEDIAEHLEREVYPFAPDLVWNEDEVTVGYEIPMTRLFYKPEQTETLEELDRKIDEKLALIQSLLAEVKK